MEDFESHLDHTSAMTGPKWASAFLKEVRENPALLDDDAFTSRWFTDAINAARTQKGERDKAEADLVFREIRAMAYYVSHHCHQYQMEEIDVVTPLEIALEQRLSADRSMLSFIREHMIRLDAREIKA